LQEHVEIRFLDVHAFRSSWRVTRPNFLNFDHLLAAADIANKESLAVAGLEGDTEQT
jgi:hypothetical protein